MSMHYIQSCVWEKVCVCLCVCVCTHVCECMIVRHVAVTSHSMVLGLQSHSAIVFWPLTLQPVNIIMDTHTHTHTAGPGGQYCPIGGERGVMVHFMGTNWHSISSQWPVVNICLNTWTHTHTHRHTFLLRLRVVFIVSVDYILKNYLLLSPYHQSSTIFYGFFFFLLLTSFHNLVAFWASLHAEF